MYSLSVVGRWRWVLVRELALSVGVCGHCRYDCLGRRRGAVHVDGVFGLRPQPHGRHLPRGGSGALLQIVLDSCSSSIKIKHERFVTGRCVNHSSSGGTSVHSIFTTASNCLGPF
jgi:hypothetical protein